MKLATADDQHGYEIGIDGYLTPDEASALVSLHKDTLARRADEGLIRRVRINSKLVRYCRRSLLEWMASHEC